MIDPSSAWDVAIGRLADLLDEIDEALATDQWDHLTAPLVRLELPPLDPDPDPATVARARAVLEDAARLAEALTERRDRVSAELASGPERRVAANRYGATARMR